MSRVANKINRRNFLQQSIVFSGSSLVLCYANDLLFPPVLHAAETKQKSSSFKPNVFIEIPSSGKINLICHRSEMGQGARTSMVMLLAEELEVDWQDINIVQGGADASYGDQNTDGSTSVRLNYMALRKAGASARSMLVQAAANRWNVKPADCYAKASKVFSKTGAALTYNELAAEAAKLPVPTNVALKEKSEFQVIGKDKELVDAKAITAGKAMYGIDTKIPKMLVASLERSPSVGGKIKSVNSKATLQVKGVQKVVTLDAIPQPVNTNASVAVVANNYWAALKGREKLIVEWTPPKGAQESSSNYEKELTSALDQPGHAMRKEGNFQDGKKAAKVNVQKQYYTPYLVHAMMEPLACIAYVQRGRCEVWAPTQDPQRAQKAVADFLKIPAAKVQIHITLLGGGFGRKSQPDFILEAVALSQKLKAPVKIIWRREDEVKHGFYHAQAMQRIEAGLDANNNIAYWRHKTAFPTIQKVFNPKALTAADWELGMGCTDMPYDVKNIECLACDTPSSVRIGWLRSVCHVFHAFAVNSMMDELSAGAKMDPIEFRLKLLKRPTTEVKPDFADKPEFRFNSKRMARVMEEVRQFAKWQKGVAKGRGQGFANHYSFFSYVAMVVEASMAKDNKVVVHAVHCVADCGVVVNPDTVKAQLEGAVIFGLSLALHGKITLQNGVVVQSNFDDYPVVRMEEAPKIHIKLIDSDEIPTGIGEPGVPPVAPALCAAIQAAGGKRFTQLPLV